jgi:uncharacterized DUF497 family protein
MLMKKLRVEELVWDDWNVRHIKKHRVVCREVERVIESKTLTLKAKKGRFLVLGLTKEKRMLTVVLAKEAEKRYYVVTARDMSKKERRYYRDQKNS